MEWAVREQQPQSQREPRWALEQRPSARREALARKRGQQRPEPEVVEVKAPRPSERPVPEPVSRPKGIELTAQLQEP